MKLLLFIMVFAGLFSSISANLTLELKELSGALRNLSAAIDQVNVEVAQNLLRLLHEKAVESPTRRIRLSSIVFESFLEGIDKVIKLMLEDATIASYVQKNYQQIFSSIDMEDVAQCVQERFSQVLSLSVGHHFSSVDQIDKWIENTSPTHTAKESLVTMYYLYLLQGKDEKLIDLFVKSIQGTGIVKQAESKNKLLIDNILLAIGSKQSFQFIKNKQLKHDFIVLIFFSAWY